MNQIYLDNQSTTPLDPNVLSEMMPWLKNKFGNASSRNHSYGWEASDAIEVSRQSIANLIGSSSKVSNHFVISRCIGGDNYYYYCSLRDIIIWEDHKVVV